MSDVCHYFSNNANTISNKTSTQLIPTDIGETRIAGANGMKRIENTYKVRDVFVHLICYYFVKCILKFSSTCLLALLLFLVMCFAEEKLTLFYTEHNKIHAGSSHIVMSC